MKTFNINILFLLPLLGLLIFGACEDTSTTEPAVVEVTAIYDADTDQHLFQTDINTIASGWTTFRLINASPATHFLFLDLLPEGKTVHDLESTTGPLFQEAMDLINEGKRDEGLAKLGEMPAWSADVTAMGGPGLTETGQTTEVTLFVEPGDYVMECYIKTDEGLFHTTLGMFKAFTVTEEQTDANAPGNPTLNMTLTNEGFDVKEDITAGKHTVAVLFDEDNPPFLGNDVHVVRLEDDTDMEKVTAWMDWSQPGGLVSHHEAQGPAEFLGGTHEMPKGYTAYFTVEFTPGRYAWISERPASNPLYLEFTVASEK